MQKERFTVSAEGLRQLNAGREPWSLVKELVQNAWDEAPQATRCDVTVRAHRNGETIVTVEDDGCGFARVADAWTLMAQTPKRRNPEKRGRFNLGEKEIIAVATSATIETVGTTVTFPNGGGRRTRRNTRKRGTRVRVTMPWDAAQAAELRLRLKRFRPTDCGLTVDGEEVGKRAPLATREATLATVIQSGPGEPLRHSRRKTRIDVLERVDADHGWIYEMGIPIQATTLPYDVDVHQKVPMPPNRTTVAPGYLKTIMTATLNAMHERLPEDSFGENWVRTALENNEIEDRAIETVKEKRYGRRAVLWSSDTDANMRATEAGYEVIHPRTMSAKERDVMTRRGGLKSALTAFGRGEEHGTPEPSNAIREAFAQWVIEIARIVGLRARVEYMAAPDAKFIAQCSANRRDPTVTFNTRYCTDRWLARRGVAQLDLVIHELAHAVANSPLEHGPKWGDACATVGAKVAHAIATGKLSYGTATGARQPRGAAAH